MPSIAELETLTKQFPDKAFPRYGLAMEYKKVARYEEAVREFEQAMTLDPNYVAAWHHCGLAYAQWGRAEDAKRVFRQGLEVARRIGNGHAAAEIAEALASVS